MPQMLCLGHFLLTRINSTFRDKIDDFAISRYSEEGINILYHLIKKRDDFATSTLFCCQYSPDEWGKQLSYEEGGYGKYDDGIRRRFTTGYTVLIEREQNK